VRKVRDQSVNKSRKIWHRIQT